jgi:Ca2+-binding EF-hand superfamily protein
MRKFGLIEISDLKKQWRKLDFNGNNVVSLAEIDKMVVEMVAGGTWPQWLNNKPALMRAYKKTILVDGDGDDWVEKKEFHALLLNIFWFNKLWQIFSVIDTGADRRIDQREFTAGLSQLGLNLSDAEATAEFQKIDGNHGGQVLFVEFCAYVRKRVNPDDHAEFDADIVSGEHCGRSMRKHHGHKATAHHFVAKKCLKDFDDLEKKIKVLMTDNKKLHGLWKTLDFNGNNIVSLAEIDKMAVEEYPLLNHKPALMRAYKATIKTGNQDDWVNKKEFKTLLGNLFYFNKIYWIFDQADGDDRRMTFDEFKKCLTLCGATMNEADAKREFSSVDKNGGGIILFDEFCAYFTAKKCPQAMSSFVAD